MTSSDQDVLDLVELIYDAVDVPSRWPIFIEAICYSTNTTHGLLALMVPGDPQFQIGCMFGWTEAQLREYGERWSYQDPCLSVNAIPEGTVGPPSLVCPDEEFRASVAYREFYAPNHCHNTCGVIIKKSIYGVSFISLCRSTDAGPYGEREFSLLRKQVPHLQRAVRLHGELSSLRSQLTLSATSWICIPLDSCRQTRTAAFSMQTKRLERTGI